MTETKWSVDPAHSHIYFKIRHLMISNVQGEFKKYESSIVTSGKDFTTAKITVTIDPSSIDTGDAKRDGHLKSADFFDVEKYKEIRFSSVKISGADGSFELWGDLKIKNVTGQIKLHVDFGGMMTDPATGEEKAGFAVTGKFDRTFWGLKWNSRLDTGGMLLSDEVMIHCETELVNKTAADAAASKAAEEKAEIRSS